MPNPSVTHSEGAFGTGASVTQEPVKSSSLQGLDEVMKNPDYGAERFYGYNGQGGAFGDVNKLAGHEQAVVGDWREKFKNDYLAQMNAGMLQSNNQMLNQAGARGFSGSALRGAQYAGGQNEVGTAIAAQDVGKMMDLQDYMSQYDALGRQNQYRAQVEQMLNNWTQAKLGYDLNQYGNTLADAQSTAAQETQKNNATWSAASAGMSAFGNIFQG